MALPMLVGGAECGPSNALQGLTKAFDQDRGIHQDLFGAGRAGPSRQTFRSQTQQTRVNSLQQEANQFFSSDRTQGFSTTANLAPAISYAPGPAPGAFDLSSLRGSLPASHSLAPAPAQAVSSSASWALDFLSNQNPQSQAALKPQVAQQHVDSRQSTPAFNSTQPGIVNPQWMPFTQRDPQWSQQYTPPANVTRPEQSTVNWDKVFQTQEALLSSSSTAQSIVGEITAQSETISKSCIPGEQDELVRTASLLLDTVKNETNPKFKESTFMALLRKIKDREVTVQGNDIVETVNQEGLSTTSRDKGKQRAVDFAQTGLPFADPTSSSAPQRQRRRSVHFQEEAGSTEGAALQEDANEVYFRQENEDYINYWNSHDTALNNGIGTSYAPRLSAPMDDWGALQADWDAFEATTTGVKPLETYQFQPRNPYLHRDQGVTRTHAMHSNGAQSFYESVLELEAAVQRDSNNAVAWCELGIKQQENEREHKAILALQRAVDLEPDHLPAWLALAISHTNDNNRVAAYDAIEQWLDRNPRYQNVIGNYRSVHGQDTERKHSELIECLMIAARSGGEDVDADVQIALAVLLNTSEEYAKARDCFSTALAVRPDDWQLYNRVGATLANSGNAEEALRYYYRALELNPAYIRARFNLGISCINMRRFEEAAHHILDALVLQDSDGAVDAIDDKRGITSSALWESLKTSCLHLQRIDLATLCDRQDLEALRREFSA